MSRFQAVQDAWSATVHNSAAMAVPRRDFVIESAFLDDSPRSFSMTQQQQQQQQGQGLPSTELAQILERVVAAAVASRPTEARPAEPPQQRFEHAICPNCVPSPSVPADRLRNAVLTRQLLIGVIIGLVLGFLAVLLGTLIGDAAFRRRQRRLQLSAPLPSSAFSTPGSLSPATITPNVYYPFP